MKIRLALNGVQTEMETPGDKRVIDLLREDFGLTGTKEACGAGECGACTILVDGRTRLSCLMTAAQLDGRSVATIEGVAGPHGPHPIQKTFVEKAAVQCGFCTPGMVLAAVALLTRHPHPTRAQIRRGLAGNLCRCTGYQKIVDAVAAASVDLEKEVS